MFLCRMWQLALAATDHIATSMGEWGIMMIQVCIEEMTSVTTITIVFMFCYQTSSLLLCRTVVHVIYQRYVTSSERK